MRRLKILQVWLGCRMRMCWGLAATVTNCCKLGGLEQQCSLSHSFGGQQSLPGQRTPELLEGASAFLGLHSSLCSHSPFIFSLCICLCLLLPFLCLKFPPALLLKPFLIGLDPNWDNPHLKLLNLIISAKSKSLTFTG